ncbi:acyl transferase/acyl hydrolase/lysophospholipase [Radiomyces spectabilis]|uniref:acyl transferase/acyl hydrolase/lysophospholipase n=1 Tax=Radiomyces spectabilis TaxID=64574 RepID=UPI00221F3C5B|nr:acyl transferase/acyl hydrolase/lysophospholipase [Radiomyces spectabilis]KAI8379657.1 acyl transferase/acyl hydrolase/lysophospholipase [Radiomyces spectabilis]
MLRGYTRHKVTTTQAVIGAITLLVVAGAIYYPRRRGRRQVSQKKSRGPASNSQERNDDQKEIPEEEGTSVLDMATSILETTSQAIIDVAMPAANDTNELIGKLFSLDYSFSLSTVSLGMPELPSVTDVNDRLYDVYVSQLENLREMYLRCWEILSLQDFRKLVEETRLEDQDASVHPEVEWDAYVREGSDLPKEELKYIKLRKERQREAFARFIGVDPLEVDVRDIPVVGIASSGGGYRAMVASSGYLKAMKDEGLLDCVMYMAGISGSTWGMAQLYSSLTDASLETLADHLRSHIHTHIANLSNFLTVLNASNHNMKMLMQGIIQRYYQQNGAISLVDIFGALLGGTLLTKKETIVQADDNSTRTMHKEYSEEIEREDIGEQSRVSDGTLEDEDGAKIRPRFMERTDVKLSKQRRYIEDGSMPMPIYCVVRHEVKEIEQAEDNHNPEDTERQREHTSDEEEEDEDNDRYQWFEFTPYEMGSEELDVWIPVWAFGRKFENGKNTTKLPEQTLGVMMGMFGSAFAASLSHFYQEIRNFLPEAAQQKMDETVMAYEYAMSTMHPISPATFPNPFYKLPPKEDDDPRGVKRTESLVSSEQLCLMDAGMDNNLPFYSLLRKGRNVDVILTLDLSADIDSSDYFERAEGYAKRRGIEGWPVGAGWPKTSIEKAVETADGGVEKATSEFQENTKASNPTGEPQDDSSRRRYELPTCTVFASTASETVHVNDKETNNNEKHTVTSYPDHMNPITVVYYPLIVNDNYDPEFDPQTAEFCSTWNFVYTAEQVAKLSDLAEANVKDNIDKTRQVLKAVWERKRKERINQA